jgi:hypothetical protein
MKGFIKEWLTIVGFAFAGLFSCIAIGYVILALIGHI